MHSNIPSEIRLYVLVVPQFVDSAFQVPNLRGRVPTDIGSKPQGRSGPVPPIQLELRQAFFNYLYLFEI